MKDHERVATTALAGGAVVGTTYTALACIPGLNLLLGGVALLKLGHVAYKAADKWYTATT